MAQLIVKNPYTQETLQTLEYHSEKDVEAALNAASLALQNSPLAKTKRLAILKELHRQLSAKKPELIKLAISEGGKPYRDTVVEIERGLQGIEATIQALSQLSGREIPMGINASSQSRIAFTHHEPLGVVVALSAFNHPINLIVHQVIPAIAAGCPFIVKPASATPLSCQFIMEQLKLAGLPKEYGQMLLLQHREATMLATDPRVSALSFIGSGEVGWKLKSLVAPGVRCTLEHGGVAPVVLGPDALLEDLLPALVRGCFYHAGQVCVSVQKIYVHQVMLENFKRGFIQETQKLVVGDPQDPQTDVGPLINKKEQQRVHSWVQEAIEQGAQLLYGAEEMDHQCYQPTILLNASKESRVYQEEVFGPVVLIQSYQHIEEVIHDINSLPYAFQAGVYGQDIDWVMGTARKLNAQTVMINDHSAFRVDWMPFGGLKKSGMGLGGMENALKDYSIEKLYVMKVKNLEE